MGMVTIKAMATQRHETTATPSSSVITDDSNTKRQPQHHGHRSSTPSIWLA